MTHSQLGDGVTGLHIGDRVGHAWLHDTCGQCIYCLRGWDTVCGTVWLLEMAMEVHVFFNTRSTIYWKQLKVIQAPMVQYFVSGLETEIFELKHKA